MKKKLGWFLMLVLSLNALPYVGGCHHDNDDDDDMTIKADTKGEHKSIKVDK